MRHGILGGTFNPPHIGHLVCAQEAYLQLELDLVTLIPARIPPHKTVEEEPGPQHRLDLCRVATERDPRFAVSGAEIARAGTSYTVDTLTELHEREPDSELYLIVGADIAAALPAWRDPERVLQLATLAIAKRRGTARARVDEALAALRGLRGADRAEFFRMPRIGISSTMIRKRVTARQPIRYLVPEGVERYIEQQGLYR